MSHKAQLPNKEKPCGPCIALPAGLDVFEDEPRVQQGLAGCQNAVLLPHIASATEWTRSGMVSFSPTF